MRNFQACQSKMPLGKAKNRCYAQAVDFAHLHVGINEGFWKDSPFLLTTREFRQQLGLVAGPLASRTEIQSLSNGKLCYVHIDLADIGRDSLRNELFQIMAIVQHSPQHLRRQTPSLSGRLLSLKGSH